MPKDFIEDFKNNKQSDVDEFQFKKIQGDAENIFDPDLDLKAFPHPFPDGSNGLQETARKFKMRNADYIKCRLLSRYPQFRLDKNYLFHNFQFQEVAHMCNSMNQMLRTVKPKQNIGDFMQRLQKQDGEMEGSLFSVQSKLRGSRRYFQALSTKVKSMIQQDGPPALFVTLSCSEWYSIEFIDYLRTINKHIPGATNMTPAELTAMDPVSVSNHFHKKWRAIFNELIDAKEKPIFGKLTNHFWRIECQTRGAPHVHCLLWIEGAPIIGKYPREKVLEYINSIAMCEMPDKLKSPTLHKPVNDHQKHRYNTYCRRKCKRGRNWVTYCGFGFPRRTHDLTVLHDILDCLATGRNRKKP